MELEHISEQARGQCVVRTLQICTKSPMSLSVSLSLTTVQSVHAVNSDNRPFSELDKRR